MIMIRKILMKKIFQNKIHRFKTALLNQQTLNKLIENLIQFLNHKQKTMILFLPKEDYLNKTRTIRNLITNIQTNSKII